MSIAKLSIEKGIISAMFALLLLVGGSISYFGLGQLEDPEFTIKKAMVITVYPGASPKQVEAEVTYPLENAIQQLPYVDYVTSVSSSGMSQITVEMKSTYRKKDLQQIWDELRRKINDIGGTFPQGVMPPQVKDDFSDVYGVLFAITGDRYSYDELHDYVDFLRRELVLVEGVGKVTTAGEQQRQVMVEISNHKASSFGIPPAQIFKLLQNQNTVSNAGKITVSGESIRLHPTGEFQHVSELENLLISNPGESKLIYLGDVATVTEQYAEIPKNIVNYGGEQALMLSISFTTGVNVVDVGKKINQRMKALEYQRPVGMEIHSIYNQPNEVENSVTGFIISLVEAIAIVIVVLLVFMGMRSGLLIGLILLLTVLGTFIFMKMFSIDLQRISLGALIIALGMLVDNAIVVTEGMLIGLRRGMTKLESAVSIVEQTKWPLLGATIIAITAFAPIGLSADSTGEFAGSLFYVLLISLMLSWVTALTLTPYFANFFFKADDNKEALDNVEQDDSDPYQGGLFTLYKALLYQCIHHRWVTVILMVAMLVAAVVNFSTIKQSFFPASNTPMFYLDYWRYQGSDIRQTKNDIEQIEQYLLKKEGVVNVTSSVGRGLPRFMLSYAPEKQYAAYGQLTIRVTNREKLDAIIADLRSYTDDNFINASVKIKRLEIGPSTSAKIEARFSGPDPDVLRNLSKQAQDILRKDAGAFNVKDNWRQRSKVIRPQINQQRARRLGISKSDVDQLLLTRFSGKQVGLYRDGTQMLPIIARSPKEERASIDSLHNLQIYSPILNKHLPLNQIVDAFEVEWEDSLIMRRDRKRTISVMADPDILGDETAAKLFKRIQPKIEAIELAKGYQLEWGGEYESAGKAQKAVFSSMPLGYIAMFAITILLFNSVRKTLVIWTTVPLAIIGVSFGLTLMNAPFSFMALLGLLSLSGMIIKNGIVLVDQINLELENGLVPYHAIIQSGVSRVRPVAMAAITTILGMVPLLFDVFFRSMAVTIMFGLGFATILTLVVLPVFYAIFFNIKLPKGEAP